MYPYLHLGFWNPGTFGLLLWLAAVMGALMLNQTFKRDRVNADALNIVAMVVIAGVIGAKAWHELENPAELLASMKQIALPGWSHPWGVVTSFFEWFKAGFAWFGGMLAGIAMLVAQGMMEKPNGLRGARAGVRMLDLAAPAAAVGYGVGRIGCLTSGDGDYGRVTTSAFWGVHMKPDALVPPIPPNALVLPTPLWEFGIALVIALVLWRLGKKARPLAWLTGVYLALTGIARFVVEFWRINPKIYFGNHFSNAQVAALGSVFVGVVIVVAVSGMTKVGGEGTIVPQNSQLPAEESAV